LTPTTATAQIGVPTSFTAGVTVANGTVERVDYSSSNTGIATVNPASDTTSPYVTQATGVSGGTVTITASVVMGGVVRCTDTSSFTVSTPSCTVDLIPASSQNHVGISTVFTSAVTPVNGTVSQVNFSSSNSGIATVNPASDTSYVYSTNVTGVAVGSATITTSVVMSGVVRCTDTSSVSVTPPDPWWQVRDGDVTAGGDLISLIPAACTLPGCTPQFELDGAGGFPGVPLYSGTTNLTTGDVSSLGWLVNSSFMSTKTYDYAYFARIIPPEITFNEITSPSITGNVLSSTGTAVNGVYWFRFSGAATGLDLTLSSAANLCARKVVLMVDSANLNIQGNINVTDSSGFFMVLVGENISGAL
jgi:hypothetical protein